MYEAAEKANGAARPPLPHRARPASAAPTISRASPSCTSIASMQPYHAIDDGRWAEKRIGPGARQNHLRLPLAAGRGRGPGLRLGLGCRPHGRADGHLCAPPPAARWTANIPTAGCRNRRSRVAEAMRAYTWGSAYASFEEAHQGRHRARQTGGYGRAVAGYFRRRSCGNRQRPGRHDGVRWQGHLPALEEGIGDQGCEGARSWGGGRYS